MKDIRDHPTNDIKVDTLLKKNIMGICRASWGSCGNWREVCGSGVTGGRNAALEGGRYGALVHFRRRQWNPQGSLNFERSMCNAVHCFGRSTPWHWLQYNSEKGLFSVPCKRETVPIDPLFLYSASDVQQTPRLKSSPPSAITMRTTPRPFSGWTTIKPWKRVEKTLQ